MKIDLHCHSKYSNDNFLEPEIVIQQALQLQLNGVCFTEHHSYMASLPIEKIAVPEGFFIFRGIEVSCNFGHLLVYGLEDDDWNVWSRDNYLEIEEVVKRVHELGGICVPAHPFRGWDSIGDRIYAINGFDAIETHNGINTPEANRKAAQAGLDQALPSIGGSDCHKPEWVGRAFTIFDNPVHSSKELIREIRLGNCRGVVKEP